MPKKLSVIQFVKSLKFKIILLVASTAILLGAVLSFGFLSSYRSRAIFLRKSEVLSQAKMLANQIASTGYFEVNSNLPRYSDEDIVKLEAQLDMLTTIYNGRLIVVDNYYSIIYDTYNLDTHKTIVSEEVVKGFAKEESVNIDSENDYIEMAIPIILTESDEDTDVRETVVGVMVVSVSTSNISLNFSYLRQIVMIVGLIFVLIIIFAGIFVSLHLVRPLDKIAADIEGIHSGYGEQTLNVNDHLETVNISKKFNNLISEMKVMDESRQEFVSNVSHELKTPLTSMKVLADSINSMGGEAPKELYQEFMGDITSEIERETKIINDLLSLVKMDKSAADLNISTININELVEQIIKRLQPIADRQQVEIVLESFRPVTAEIDEVKMTLAITNLIENGIKYNKVDGERWVHVSLNADHQYFYLKVEDSGMGIPEEALEHIYERFYRVDKSHSREIGGTGLGLAITRSCILMHRGAIKVHSVLGEGTTFDVRIPLNYIA